jgi:hypothetical protein
MGFSFFTGTEDVQSKYFAVASEIVPTILYSGLISWVKYRRDYYQYGQSEPILPSPKLKNVMVECMTQFLYTDVNNFKSSLVDPITFESLKALIIHHKYNFSCEDSCQRFSTMLQQDEPNLLSWDHLKSYLLKPQASHCLYSRTFCINIFQPLHNLKVPLRL